MAIKAVFMITLGLWLVVQWTQAAPSYAKDVEDFEGTATFDLAKRLLDEESALRSRLRKIENIKRVMLKVDACGSGKKLKGATCVSAR